MKHYHDSDWADYARGLVDDTRHQAMREHLAGGCGRCRRVVRDLETVAAVAAADLELAPPELAVRSVKAWFGLQQPAGAERTTVLGLKLVFDSALAPATAPVRGEDDERRLVLQSEDYTLELHLQKLSAEELCLVGSLVEQPDRPVEDAEALLVAGGEIAASAVTSEIGDFTLACRRGLPAELWIHLDEEQRIQVALGNGVHAPEH